MASRKPRAPRKSKPTPDPLTPIFNAAVAELPTGWLRTYLESK